jgi:hypothetical protein
LAEKFSQVVMGTTKKGPRYVADDEQGSADAVIAMPLPEPPAELDASLCAGCGEPLAWHDTHCSLPGLLNVAAEPPVTPLSKASSAYAYNLGQPVQPVIAAQPHRIIWRGQLKERHPRTGWVHRVNVYRLDDGHWDCYREDELQVA